MYEKKLNVPSDPFRVSALFRELQDISGDAVASWHLTGAELEKQGLMWVVVRYEVSILRELLPGESLTLSTWASPFRHRLSQRNYIACDQSGANVLLGAGIWALADRKTRMMVAPEEYKIDFPGEINGRELQRPGTPNKLETRNKATYIVTDNVLDMNGHMNNTRYFDLAQDLTGEEMNGKGLSQIRAVYSSETRLGDEISIQWGRSGPDWYFAGEKSGETCFQISFHTA